jgi:undecaprenyl-diphosphatase
MNFWTGLLEWDVQALLSINALHNPWMDRFVWLLSETMVWSPAVLVLLYVLIKNKKIETIWIVLAIALLFVFTDQVAGSVIKPLVGRLRPTRNPEVLPYLDVVNAYLGGTYGFPSNHAANAFAFAGFSALLFKNKIYSLSIFFWAAMVAFSRIYLGVHYPLDVIAGALFGFFVRLDVLRPICMVYAAFLFVEPGHFVPSHWLHTEFVRCKRYSTLVAGAVDHTH